ncbi:MAG TPA: helix-turn-helix transcriptional regulator [Solirubrobacteraceae bacterium]|nr:helix-turn-helix transcriptional regulator [Solirubrobacteraceae bacterium]
MPRRSTQDKALGEALRGLRDRQGLTQEALASRAGITTGTYARLELGQSDPSWSTLRAVAKALGVTLSQLARAVEAHEKG